MAFYQKFRPQKFADIVGQDHITTTLAGAIMSGKISHAYLFTGPRGLGKTSIARIMAKAINCRQRTEQEYEPCDKCQNCKEISDGNSLDVIEIDAASNRGIDEIRDLREKIKFGPSNSKFKVYIIDEVHMLTEPAFNALLKTIEEPPSHAIFILATTELHKVPLTIVSRCQKFDFHRAGPDVVAEKLSKIVKKEKIAISKDALQLLASLAEGSFRDGESLLDQIAAGNENEEISIAKIEQILGLSPRENIYKLISLLLAGDQRGALSHLESEYANGRDIKQLIYELTQELRSILLIKTIGQPANKAEKAIAADITLEEIFFLLNNLVATAHEQKSTNLPQLGLEMLAINFISEFRKTPETLTQPAKSEKVADSSVVKENQLSAKSVESDKSSLKISKESWEQFLKDLKPLNHSLHAILGEAKLLSADNSELRIGVRFKFYADRVNEKQFKKDFDELTEKTFGQKMKVTAVLHKEDEGSLPDREAKALIDDTLEVFEVE